MPSETSPAAALYSPRLGPPGPAAGFSSRGIPRGAPTAGTIAAAVVSPSRGLRRVLSALGSFGEIVAVAFAFPLVILAVGIPVALLVRLVIWIVRALYSGAHLG